MNIGETFRFKVQHDNKLSMRTAEAMAILQSLGRGYVVEQPWPWKQEEGLVIDTDAAMEQRCLLPRGNGEVLSLQSLLGMISVLTLTIRDRYLATAVEGSAIPKWFLGDVGVGGECPRNY